MHMADALISPVVGGTMMAATTGIAVYSAIKVKNEMDEKKIPLMGIMGAFIFAAQMINFSIPGTGSSGHLGGGLLLAALLGPYAGFLSMAVILLIQALVFADGGFLAYGCNVFNLAFYPCFIAYPLIYKLLTKRKKSYVMIMTASIIGAIVSLQLGSFSVVLQTLFSGKTELPFSMFVLLMQPIHLGIGLVEGLITGSVLIFIRRSRPEILEKATESRPLGNIPIKNIVIIFAIITILTGGVLSWFASSHPDGLEWSMQKTSGQEELDLPGGIHESFSGAQEKTSFLPDYGFKEETVLAGTEEETPASWPAPDTGTTISGLIGGAIVFIIASGIGFLIWIIKKKKKYNVS